MVASNLKSASNFLFDDSRIDWGPFPYVQNAEFSLYDFDEERQIIDLIFRGDGRQELLNVIEEEEIIATIKLDDVRAMWAQKLAN